MDDVTGRSGAEPVEPAEPVRRTPRWVKACLVGVAVLVGLVVLLLLTGHGPGRHLQHGLGVAATAGGAAGR